MISYYFLPPLIVTCDCKKIAKIDY